MMFTLNKVVVPRSREMQSPGIVKDIVETAEDSRPRQPPFVLKERCVPYEKPEPGWEWAKVTKQRAEEGSGDRRRNVAPACRYVSEGKGKGKIRGRY